MAVHVKSSGSSHEPTSYDFIQQDDGLLEIGTPKRWLTKHVNIILYKCPYTRLNLFETNNNQYHTDVEDLS